MVDSKMGSEQHIHAIHDTSSYGYPATACGKSLNYSMQAFWVFLYINLFYLSVFNCVNDVHALHEAPK